jgi:periplasmic glucans biosynthesis protein
MNRLRTVFVSLWVGTAAFLVAFAAIADAPQVEATPSFFEILRQQAMDSAREDFAEPEGDALPEFLRELDYDAYMRIQFRHDRSLWHSEPFRYEVQFFHPGYLFQDPVRMHLLEHARAREVQFSPELFDYSQQPFPEPVPQELFFAGLRLHFPLDHPWRKQEVAVFLGSSYFRAIAAGQVFGASARGLSIDTAEPSGEEFPRFTEFWVEQPTPTADQIRLFARLESRRATGAYQFLIRPGEPTVMDVEASVFLREPIAKLGVAPLTSMFFFGENRDRYFPDFRPEVHDSDGLLFRTDEGWFWRPLENPPKVHRVSVFPSPAAFGLMQRDRNPGHYQDLEARYEDRPSFWITPQHDWGPGHLELVEIPTPEEGNDNIVAYWVPDLEYQAGREFRFRYTIRAGQLRSGLPPAALWRVHSTRLNPGKEDGSMRFIVDWSSHARPLLAREPVTAWVQASRGKTGEVVTQPNHVTGGWRTFFDLSGEGKEPIELRLRLEQDGETVSETWIYHFSPSP